MRGNCEGLSVPRRESFFFGDWGFFMGTLREAKNVSRRKPDSALASVSTPAKGARVCNPCGAESPARSLPPCHRESRLDPEREPFAFPKLNPPPFARHPPPISRA